MLGSGLFLPISLLYFTYGWLRSPASVLVVATLATVGQRLFWSSFFSVVASAREEALTEPVPLSRMLSSKIGSRRNLPDRRRSPT